MRKVHFRMTWVAQKRLCFFMFRFSAEDEVRSPTPSDGQSRNQKKTRRKNSLPHKIGRHRPSIGQHPDFHSKHEVWILGNINHTTKEHLQSNQWYFVLDLTYILQSELQWNEILWAIQITFLSCCYSVLLSAARLLTHKSCWRLYYIPSTV